MYLYYINSIIFCVSNLQGNWDQENFFKYSMLVWHADTEKMITFLRTKYFLMQHHLVFVNMKYFFVQHQFFCWHQNTFSCNINTFLSTPDYFLYNVKLFVSAQNYFSFNAKYFFWGSFRMLCHGDIFYCHIATKI